MSKKNDVVLFISDLHAPYQHKDALRFLKAIKKKYKPTRVICTGDEVDYHALSFHASDPDLDSAGVELKKAIAFIKKLECVFPDVELVNSNHGSMVYRKGKVNGMPRHVLKPYREVLGVDWTWSDSITDLELNLFVIHGSKKNSETYSKQLGMNVVQGHYHEDLRLGFNNNPGGLIWGMNIGCLIDDESYAFAYNKVNPSKPALGTGIIINGIPQLIPMLLDDNKRWIGKL